MALALYNTLTRRVESFEPLHPPRVTMYTCGPTVWNYAHIGNFRTFLFEDLLRRYLESLGYDVFHVMNLTDVDDRTIQTAADRGVSLATHTAPYTRAFFEDRDFLLIKPAHVYPTATGSIAAMVSLITTLLDKQIAYRGEDGSIYFAIDRFAGYGRLSQLDRRELKVGARVASDEYGKDDPRDFALWKRVAAVDEQVGAAWDAPFGRGRPGWHIECSGMSLHEIGSRFGVRTLDIHAGGVDNIFPHHEDEIAQSEAATGEPFARYWLHGAFLNVKGSKMSKRFGNFLTVRDLREQGVDPRAFRHLVFSAHYRQELDFNDDALAAATEGARRLGEFGARIGAETRGGDGTPRLEALATEFLRHFAEALDDDLNAPRALGRVHEFARAGNRALDAGEAPGPATRRAWEAFEALFECAIPRKVVGGASLTVPSPVIRGEGRVDSPEGDDEGTDPWAARLAAERDRAKQAKDYATADRIRDRLREHGYELRDRKAGPSQVFRR